MYACHTMAIKDHMEWMHGNKLIDLSIVQF
jgi:hypothetical protein